MNKAVPEVKQLLTEYGDIGIFWWDTPRKMSRESFDALHSLTGLQDSVITNDRLGEDYPGDYKTFERRIPDRAPVGKDWEVCMPISGSWGYKIGDENFKSTTTLIQNLIRIASMGGNYLLNVSPTGEGILLPQAVERLKAVGQWVEDGETKLYLHVYDWPSDGKLLVPGLKNAVQEVSLLNGGSKLQAESSDAGVTISLPAQAPNEHASVVVVKVQGTLEVEAVLPTVGTDGTLAPTEPTSTTTKVARTLK